MLQVNPDDFLEPVGGEPGFAGAPGTTPVASVFVPLVAVEGVIVDESQLFTLTIHEPGHYAF